MEAQEAKKLRKETFGKSCNHEVIEMEYESGSELGYMACTTCGAEFLDKKVWSKLREYLELVVVSQSNSQRALT